MPTPYSTIYQSFSNKINDPVLATLTQPNQESIMHTYLFAAVPKFIKCQTDLTSYDDTLQQFNNTLSPLEIEILAKKMVLEWLEPQIQSIYMVKQLMNSSDFKIYSQAQHLHELENFRKRLYVEIDDLTVQYTYNYAPNAFQNLAL